MRKYILVAFTLGTILLLLTNQNGFCMGSHGPSESEKDALRKEGEEKMKSKVYENVFGEKREEDKWRVYTTTIKGYPDINEYIKEEYK